MTAQNSAMVAALAERSPHPFSSIAMSSNRQHALIAGKDTLQLVKIDSSGIKSLRKMKISQYFQASVAPNDHRSSVGKVYGDVRDTFKLAVKQTAHSHPRNTMTHMNVVVTGVAWSMPQSNTSNEGGSERPDDGKDDNKNESLIAAAGSNGVVAVWNARQAFFSDGNGGSSTLANQQPEAILSQHTRAVNSLAWHPRRPGFLLTASQDATVKLWERREVAPRKEQEKNNSGSRFGFFNQAKSSNSREYSWYCRNTFEPKSEAVREIQWSKFQDDIFGLVTVSGSLVVYSMHVAMRALVKIAAHTGDATSLDWHPTRPYVVATGGSGDRCVKVWELENSLNMNKKDEHEISANSGTWNTARSEVSTNSASSSETERSGPSISGFSSVHSTFNSNAGRTLAGLSQSGTSRHKSNLTTTLHVLSISSSVTKVRWRPPAFDSFPTSDGEDEVDRHASMLAVSTARLTSAGGSGVISLWSYHRPFMPLSVVEGHEEGAVTDFAWLQTPQVNLRSRNQPRFNPSDTLVSSSKHDSRRLRKMQVSPLTDETSSIRPAGRGEIDSILFDNNNKEKDDVKSDPSTAHIWQHVLSVGRDGRCILQSLTRGDRPISRVPSSCFAIANLSPFQRGHGSLQLFSVSQRVPNTAKDDFQLTGLRQDEYTARAPGIFKEAPDEDTLAAHNENDEAWTAGKRLPANMPDITFNVVDQGDLDANGLPVDNQDETTICVGPEVVHLSRFASAYKLYPDSRFPTRVDLCLHNGRVAEDHRCIPLARMWRSVASILSGSGLDELPPPSQPANAMQFTILPTIKSLLLERADAGDVQTCVALCELLQVIESDQQTRIPGLDLNLVREWYLSYIDLLQQMCLFSAASYLIRSCKDPFIGKLNQQSTTIHESCPRCGKALLPNTETTNSSLDATSRRACKNCRRRVGLCFLCHEPVKGMFVWCPGCGHGGHLEHALQWFGGLSGNAVREVCPTGCGHRCNFAQQLTAFPRTDSLMCLPTSDALNAVSKS